MASTYPKYCKNIPDLNALTKILAAALLALVLYSCKPANENQELLRQIEQIEQTVEQQAQRLIAINLQEYKALNVRFERIVSEYQHTQNNNIIEVLASGSRFLQLYPAELDEINKELNYARQQIENLHKEAKNQLYTKEELAMFITNEKARLELLSTKVDFMVNNFNSWLLNAETLESGLDQTTNQ
jgi:DNA gyrase/topoisomerase IV subunit A